MVTMIVGGIICKDNRFLLVQEAKEKFRGKWNIPAGKLELNESVFEGAKREILEETGCSVELMGILEIRNVVLANDTWLSVIFKTQLLDENVSYDKSEILDVKWFTYDEVKAMRTELRDYDYIMNSINNLVVGKIADIDIIEIVK